MTGENTISLVGATIHEVDGNTCTITLTELQRSLAIAISGTSGGDGGAAILDVYADGVRDHGENTNLNNEDIKRICSGLKTEIHKLKGKIY